jgi:hypothetical protein
MGGNQCVERADGRTLRLEVSAQRAYDASLTHRESDSLLHRSISYPFRA